MKLDNIPLPNTDPLPKKNMDGLLPEEVFENGGQTGKDAVGKSPVGTIGEASGPLASKAEHIEKDTEPAVGTPGKILKFKPDAAPADGKREKATGGGDVRKPPCHGACGTFVGRRDEKGEPCADLCFLQLHEHDDKAILATTKELPGALMYLARRLAGRYSGWSREMCVGCPHGCPADLRDGRCRDTDFWLLNGITAGLVTSGQHTPPQIVRIAEVLGVIQADRKSVV